MQGNLREVYLRIREHFKSPKKGEFRPEFRGLSRISSTESSASMERAMGIELHPQSKGLVLC